MKRVIFTADDFGAAAAINAAVELGATRGILNTASLMVTGAALDDALAVARRVPGLRVGLHVALADARPCLAPGEIPDLVDRDGRFRNDLVGAGFRFFFLPRVRRQLRAEIEAQFDAFARTGLVLDHVNAHKHLHFHPTVLDAILDIGPAFGMRALRLPREPFAPTPGNILMYPLRLLLARMRRRAALAGVALNDYIFGLEASGRMDEERLLALLRRCPEGVTEFYFHPASEPDGLPLPAGYEGTGELRALTSVAVAGAIKELGLVRVGFGDLAAA